MRKFFLGMEEELLLIEETSNGYKTSTHLKGTQPIRIAVDPQNNYRIYCATYGHGLWKSEDGGLSWIAIGKVGQYHEPPKGEGITSARITSVKVHPNKKSNGNSIVYVGTEPSALYSSSDNGNTWIEFKSIQNLFSKPTWQFPPRPFTNHVRWITPSYDNENHIGVSIEFGAFIYTKNHGEVWNDRPFLSPMDIHTLLAHPQAPGRLYAACGDGLLSEGKSYAESMNEGKEWRYLSEGLEKHPYLYNLAINKENPNDRIVSAAKDPNSAHHKNLYSTIYRKQGTNNWKEISNGLPTKGSYIFTLAADPYEGDLFYAMSNLGLYKWDELQKKWEQLEIAWKEEYKQQHPSSLLIV
ncbi:WD40/YVTN/BNR-like repeat-containing protein [Priestia aryabhattai]|uniref:WD40/YVTN/BNR-like repeat-containing protein n=1 Tax=Priestia aryabhattai TaxID=412384 RepID=UPI001875E4BB|nr:sialidase family protein [Priestia aryabhattai]MBE5102330.1 exo-alpha-sialidase [Priestia aryabhattai]